MAFSRLGILQEERIVSNAMSKNAARDSVDPNRLPQVPHVDEEFFILEGGARTSAVKKDTMGKLSMGDTIRICSVVLCSSTNKQLSQDNDDEAGSNKASRKVTTARVKHGADTGDTHLNELIYTKH
jgi:hypothetical protein